MLWLLLLAAAAPSHGQQGYGHLRLVFAGDLMGHMPLHSAALQPDGSYDYSPCFQYVKDYIQSADVAILNLEVTLAGKPYTGYPCFSAPDAIAEAAHQAGFDVFTTANNHCMDKGSRGLERTLDVLDTFGMYMGIATSHVFLTYDPDVIVIGGGVSKAGEILIPPIEKYLVKFSHIANEKCKVVLASLGNDAGIYGAAALAKSIL